MAGIQPNSRWSPTLNSKSKMGTRGTGAPLNGVRLAEVEVVVCVWPHGEIRVEVGVGVRL